MRYRLRTLVMLTAIGPQVLAGIYFAARTFSDFALLLAIVIPIAVVGLGIGLALRRYKRPWCDEYAAWSNKRSWWLFAALAVFFLIMTAGSVHAGQPSFATASFRLMPSREQKRPLFLRSVGPPPIASNCQSSPHPR